MRAPAIISARRMLILLVTLATAAAMFRPGLGQAQSGDGSSGPTKKAILTTRTRGGPRVAFHRPAMTAEQKEEFRQFAEEHVPELYEQYQELEKDDPRQAGRLFQRIFMIWRRMQMYPAGPVRNAAMARQRLAVEIYKNVRAYREAEDPAARSELRTRLSELLGQRFDHDQVLKEYDVERLRKQLADLKAEIEQRRRQRAETIEDMLRHLLDRSPTSRRSDPDPS
jgi:hypothetical protein